LCHVVVFELNYTFFIQILILKQTHIRDSKKKIELILIQFKKEQLVNFKLIVQVKTVKFKVET